MKKPWMILLLLFLLLGGCSGRKPDQTSAPTPTGETEQVTPAGPVFKNPVLRTNFPDPFLLQVGDTWYAFATNGSGKNVQLATSTNLIQWSLKSDAMPALAKWVQLNRSDVWAPEVLELEGTFLLYYTARDAASGKQCVGVTVSEQPGGKYLDPHEAPLVCQTDQGGTIDASPFRDGDKLYLLYKNDGNCCGFPTYLYIQELTPDGLGLVGEPVALIRNDQRWEGQVIEAPTLVNRLGKYYLFYSANSYAGHEYAVGYALCETPLGPCEKAAENPILSSRLDEQPFVIGPGHQTIITVGDQDWLVYHAWDILPSGTRGDSRYMWLDRLDWSSGKPVILGPTTDSQPAP
jgi:beta-xylosidase